MEASFRLEGVVCAVAPEINLVALQDTSGTLLLKLPAGDMPLLVGQTIAIEGNMAVVYRTAYGVELRHTLIVDNGGVHSPREKSGSVFLNTEMHPIRVEWFNGPTEFALSVEVEGPETRRQKVSNSWLWWTPKGVSQDKDFQQGLHYEAFEITKMIALGDVDFKEPVAGGVATNFSTAYRTRNEECALVFDGFIQINHPGLYTFFLTSDDGSRLYVGKPSVTFEVIEVQEPSTPQLEIFEDALRNRSSLHWIELVGEVVFVSKNQRSLQLELLVGGNRVPVTVIDGSGLFSTNLLQHWVKVQGISSFSAESGHTQLVGVFVPSASQVRVEDLEERTQQVSAKDHLTMAAQVRRLRPLEAGKHLPARIRGVVIYAASTAVVLRDSSGGVFISCGAGVWEEQPKVGEFWEMEGTTDPGLFSPTIVADKARFLGYAPLPEPVQPTRDQLMNGNMDAEYGELHGVITSITNDEIALLTADGKVTIVGNEDRPLPELPESPSGDGSIVGSVVRIRGCFAPSVNVQTRQVAPGEIYIYPSLVEVVDTAPNDPFQLPTKTATDLMWFDARSSVLLRTKLAGQIIYSSPGEYFVFDGKQGFRVQAKDSVSIVAGDLVEAVGFPKLDGPSPVLLESRVRRVGHASLPSPGRISAGELLDRTLDSTLVEVEAVLISDTDHPGERVLELQSGPRHFLARLYRGKQDSESLPPGSQLRVVGVYASADKKPGNLTANVAPFELLINRVGDVVVLSRPSWWTIQRVFMVLMILCGVLGMMFVWVALLRRTVEERTVQLTKEIEQRQWVEQNHAIEKERTRVARDLHDELGAGLTEVGMLGSLANSAAVPPEAKSRYLDQLTNAVHSLVTSLDEIVWAVNPDYDTVNSVVSYFSLLAESFLSLAGIKCRLRVMEPVQEQPLDSKSRHEVCCAFREALNNVIRHSGATEVQIAFEVVEGVLIISVIDNGRGFEFKPDQPGKDGLNGLRRRMQSLGGECLLASQIGQGTKVVIRLPLN